MHLRAKILRCSRIFLAKNRRGFCLDFDDVVHLSFKEYSGNLMYRSFESVIRIRKVICKGLPVVAVALAPEKFASFGQ